MEVEKSVEELSLTQIDSKPNLNLNLTTTKNIRGEDRTRDLQGVTVPALGVNVIGEDRTPANGALTSPPRV